MRDGPPQPADGTPMVSVAMTAFNSQAWIKRAIESVLLQKTPFSVELVVGDDCSKDDTASVVQSYVARYPGRVRLLERSGNVGMQRNFYETFESCRGRYIAWLDADDYWTDPEKLALQVEVLESDPGLSICGHFVRFVDSSGEVIDPRYPRRPGGRYSLGDIIVGNFVPSLSIMFRNGLHRDLPDSYFGLSGVTDWPILLLGGTRGDLFLVDRVMADYHRTPGSAYNAKGFLFQHALDMEVREQMESMLAPKWRRQIRAGFGRQYESLAHEYRMHGDLRGARKAALQAFLTPALADNIGSKTKALAAAVLYGARGGLGSALRSFFRHGAAGRSAD